MKTSRAAPETAIYRGFACPYEYLNQRFLETVAVEYARGYAQRFVERCRRSLVTHGHGLSQFFDAGLEKPLAFDTAWDNSFGQARRAVAEADTSGLMRRAAALGLRLFERGLQGEWELEMEAPVRLQWDRWLLPSTRWIKVTGDPSAATIHTNHRYRKRKIKIRRFLDNCVADGADSLPIIESHGQRCILVPKAAVDAFPLDDVRELKYSRDSTAARNILRAFDLLAHCAPIYLPWIGRVLRKIIPVESRRHIIFSGGDQNHPGTVYMSIHCPPAALAEMLIHEATHQYFYLLARYGALDDGSGRTYFSPIKGRERPVSMILLAYHAFGNVLLFYRLCRRKHLSDAGYCRKNEIELTPQLQKLEEVLRSTNALTPLGEALWRPVSERLW